MEGGVAQKVCTVTVVSSLIILLLVVSEFNYYLSVDTDSSLQVDVTRDEHMNINFNISFPRIACMSTWHVGFCRH